MNKKLFLSIVICMLIGSATIAQVTTLSNISFVAPQFVGYDGTGPGGAKHLDEKNLFANRNINFFTNGTAVNGTSVQRMTIIGSAGATAGFVGIGPGFTAPASMLHIHDGFGSTFQMTNLVTTAAAGRGFRVRLQTKLDYLLDSVLV